MNTLVWIYVVMDLTVSAGTMCVNLQLAYLNLAVYLLTSFAYLQLVGYTESTNLD